MVVTRASTENGIGLQVLSLALELQQRGHRVTVIAGSHDGTYGDLVPVRGLRGRFPFLLTALIAALNAWLLVRGSAWVHNFEVPVFGRWHVLHMHGDCYDPTKLPDRKGIRRTARIALAALLRSQCRVAVRTGRSVAVPSRSLARRLAEGGQVSEARFLILPNTLPMTDYLRSRPLSQNRRSAMGLVAQGDVAYKGVDRAVDLLRILSAHGITRLEVAGSDSPDLGTEDPRVAYLGHLNRHNYCDWLSQLRLLVVASDYESFSLAGLEAMLCGTPLLALGELGLAEFTGHLLQLDDLTSGHSLPEPSTVLAEGLRILETLDRKRADAVVTLTAGAAPTRVGV